MRTPTFPAIMPPASLPRISVTKVGAWRLMRAFFCRFRTAYEASETLSAEREEQFAGREEAQDGLQRRTTGQAQAGIHRESIFDGEKAAATLTGAEPEWGADQDLVSEQAGEDKEGERTEKSVGPTANGAGSLQSFHRAGGRGWRGDRSRKQSLRLA